MSEPLSPTRTPSFEARLKKRYAAERRFRAMGLGAILFSVAVLLFLLVTMTLNGIGGFQRVTMQVPVDFTQVSLTVPAGESDRATITRSLEMQGLRELVQFSAEQSLGQDAAKELNPDAWRIVAEQAAADPVLLRGKADFELPASGDLASAYSSGGHAELAQMAERLASQGKLSKNFDSGFLVRSDATDPQQVGIWGALKGSMLTMLVTLSLAFPIGVFAALYLEEYARRNRWTDLIEVSINNLAAVPSIIFGLLGLGVFLTIFPNMRSAPLIGGMTLALMTMPVIVIAGRNAIKAVPPSIRDGAMALGASPVQVVFHHVLPLALPGILTGTIIGMARALGETAPLLMIGMRAFVATPPDGFTDPSTVLPVQIFLWSDEIDRGFVERTSAAIIVLLLFLLVMNGLAIYLRNRFEKKW
jgi:phosphate transport system permease protein